MWKRITDHKAKTHNIIPIGEKHTEDECECWPRIQIINGWKIYTHHSADKREYFEEDTECKSELIN